MRIWQRIQEFFFPSSSRSSGEDGLQTFRHKRLTYQQQVELFDEQTKRQMQEYDRQVKVFDRHAELADKQFSRQSKQGDRLDALLDIREEQARRLDRILDAQEKQLGLDGQTE